MCFCARFSMLDHQHFQEREKKEKKKTPEGVDPVEIVNQQ